VRAFIGIDFSQEVKNEIAELQGRLRKYAPKGRWKHRDNFHLTLKFLDEITPTQKLQIDDVIQKLCIKRKPFKLGLKGLGTFKGKDSIRVLWLGLSGDVQNLKSIHQEIDNALASLGFPPEKRRFNPHVTIGQDIIFECDFDEIRDAIGDIDFGVTKVDSLFLFKSEQIGNKRIYSKVSEYGFLK